MAVKKIVGKVKDKVIDIASDVLSLPARFTSYRSQIKSAQDYADIKMVNDFKGKPDEGNYSDPLFRARTNVNLMKFQMEKDKKKLETARAIHRRPSTYDKDYVKMRDSMAA